MFGINQNYDKIIIKFTHSRHFPIIKYLVIFELNTK